MWRVDLLGREAEVVCFFCDYLSLTDLIQRSFHQVRRQEANREALEAVRPSIKSWFLSVTVEAFKTSRNPIWQNQRPRIPRTNTCFDVLDWRPSSDQLNMSFQCRDSHKRQYRLTDLCTKVKKKYAMWAQYINVQVEGCQSLGSSK